MFEDLSPNDRILIGIIAFIVLAGVVESAPLMVLLLVLGFAALNRSQGNSRSRARVTVDEMEPQVVRERRPANAEQIYQHALTAVRATGLNPDKLPVLPVDLGVISYHGDKSPVIHRTWPLQDDADYIQPFVQLRLSNAAVGHIRFEINDAQGQTIFSHDDAYQLQRGRNLITPASRLPIHDEQGFDGRWSLLVYADNMIIAEHRFAWESGTSERVDPQVGEDGEINSELRAVLNESQLGEMSLDELLAYQDDEASAQAK